MIALICAALGGAMFYLSQGLDDVWLLAWIAPVPLLWLAYGEAKTWEVLAASFFAFAMGMIYFFQTYGTIMYVGGTIFIALNSVLFALTILLARRAWRHLPPVAALFAFPAFWTTAEYLEGWISPHGAWGALGYSQTAWPAAIQLAAFTGVYGITFILCLFANGLAMAARGRIGAGALAIGLCLAVLAGGYLRLSEPSGPSVRVAALAVFGKDYYARAFQAGDPAGAGSVSQAYAAAIRAEAAKGARYFVTTEDGVEWGEITPIAKAAEETRSLVIVGTNGRNPPRDMAVAFVRGDRPVIYDKRHLLLPLENIYKPGTRSGVIGNGMAMAVCKDLDFPRTIRSDAQAGIRLMMVPAGDFEKDAWMHARQAAMRGVENGFAVLRSAVNGLETVSDAHGRILASAPVDHFGIIVTHADVAPGPGTTPYARFGDVFSWLAAMAAVALAAASLIVRRR